MTDPSSCRVPPDPEEQTATLLVPTKKPEGHEQEDALSDRLRVGRDVLKHKPGIEDVEKQHGEERTKDACGPAAQSRGAQQDGREDQQFGPCSGLRDGNSGTAGGAGGGPPP